MSVPTLSPNPNAIWQQILAVDARYNAFRAPGDPQFRTLYIRRRSQLLRERAKKECDSNGIEAQKAAAAARKQYIKTRHQMLQQRYGAAICLADGSSIRSRTTSVRSSRVNLTEGLEGSSTRSPQLHGVIPASAAVAAATGSSGNRLRSATAPLGAPTGAPGTTALKHYLQQITAVPGPPLPHLPTLTPTYAADASRALVGDSTVSETYAFAGVHHIFDQHQAAVVSVQFGTNDESRLACCSLDGTLSICQLIPSPATVICLLRGHTKGVSDFRWCQSNDLLVSSSYDTTCRVWSVSSGECLRCIWDPVKAEVLAAAFHPVNNNMVVTGNSKGFVQVVNVSTGKYVKEGSSRTSGHITALSFDNNGHLLWAGDSKGVIHSYKFDCASGKISKCRKISISEPGCRISCISTRQWSTREAKDPLLLVNSANNSLYLFRIIDKDGNIELKRRFGVKHKQYSIRSSFCPIMSFRTGACVVSGSEDCAVHVFDITRENKPCINKLQGHSAPVLDVCFNYNESLLASCDTQGLVIIWKRELK